MNNKNRSQKILVIIPCGQEKIWRRNPKKGPTPAQFAYTGSPFKVNMKYAKHFADHWIILSAKYGFIEPNFIIPEDYNVTFKKKSTNPVPYLKLQQQIREQNLTKFDLIIELGGKEYREMIKKAFIKYSVEPNFPFSGQPICKCMKNIKEAIINNDLKI